MKYATYFLMTAFILMDPCRLLIRKATLMESAEPVPTYIKDWDSNKII